MVQLEYQDQMQMEAGWIDPRQKQYWSVPAMLAEHLGLKFQKLGCWAKKFYRELLKKQQKL